MYENEEERNDRKKKNQKTTREVALTNDKSPQIHLKFA